MFKGNIFNVLPVMYILIPIILGLLLRFIYKKFKPLSFLGTVISSIVLSVLYIEILGIFYPQENNIQLQILLYLWNSLIIFLSSSIYSLINNQFFKK